ncbi:MAG: hypothetical protein ACXV2C_08070 [Candidatus Bathyarchaeia archaeon]
MEAKAENKLMSYATIALDHVQSTCTDKIVPRKTVVYETLVDPTVIKVAGERLKRHLFTKFWLFKPKLEFIQLSSMKKYYEPYLVISARYFLDYYRVCVYTISIDNDVQEVILLDKKLYPEKDQNSTKSMRLEGEERLVLEKKAFFMLGKDGQEANLETLPSAPSEKNPQETIEKHGINEIDSEADIDFVRKRLVQRPENLSRIVNEIFEIGERVVIYAPRFKLTYVNAYNYEEKSIEFDGVTSKRIPDEKIRSRVVRPIKSTLNTIIKKLEELF